MNDNMERTSLVIYINRETGALEIRNDNALFDRKEKPFLTRAQVKSIIKGLIENYKLINDSQVEVANRKFQEPTVFTPSPIRSGNVYLMRGNGLHKIGYTRMEVGKRRNQIQKQRGFPVQIVHSFISANPESDEQQLHERFAELNVFGEWFALSDEDVQEICSIKGIE